MWSASPCPLCCQHASCFAEWISLISTVDDSQFSKIGLPSCTRKASLITKRFEVCTKGQAFCLFGLAQCDSRILCQGEFLGQPSIPLGLSCFVHDRLFLQLFFSFDSGRSKNGKRNKHAEHDLILFLLHHQMHCSKSPATHSGIFSCGYHCGGLWWDIRRVGEVSPG